MSNKNKTGFLREIWCSFRYISDMSGNLGETRGISGKLGKLGDSRGLSGESGNPRGLRVSQGISRDLGDSRGLSGESRGTLGGNLGGILQRSDNFSAEWRVAGELLLVAKFARCPYCIQTHAHLRHSFNRCMCFGICLVCVGDLLLQWALYLQNANVKYQFEPGGNVFVLSVSFFSRNNRKSACVCVFGRPRVCVWGALNESL